MSGSLAAMARVAMLCAPMPGWPAPRPAAYFRNSRRLRPESCLRNLDIVVVQWVKIVGVTSQCTILAYATTNQALQPAAPRILNLRGSAPAVKPALQELSYHSSAKHAAPGRTRTRGPAFAQFAPLVLTMGLNARRLGHRAWRAPPGSTRRHVARHLAQPVSTAQLVHILLQREPRHQQPARCAQSESTQSLQTAPPAQYLLKWHWCKSNWQDL